MSLLPRKNKLQQIYTLRHAYGICICMCVSVKPFNYKREKKNKEVVSMRVYIVFRKQKIDFLKRNWKRASALQFFLVDSFPWTLPRFPSTSHKSSLYIGVHMHTLDIYIRFLYANTFIKLYSFLIQLNININVQIGVNQTSRRYTVQYKWCEGFAARCNLHNID